MQQKLTYTHTHTTCSFVRLLARFAALIEDEDLHLYETRKWRKLHPVQTDQIGLVYQCK